MENIYLVIYLPLTQHTLIDLNGYTFGKKRITQVWHNKKQNFPMYVNMNECIPCLHKSCASIMRCWNREEWHTRIRNLLFLEFLDLEVFVCVSDSFCRYKARMIKRRRYNQSYKSKRQWKRTAKEEDVKKTTKKKKTVMIMMLAMKQGTSEEESKEEKR
jgi:hypothetical protein